MYILENDDYPTNHRSFGQSFVKMPHIMPKVQYVKSYPGQEENFVLIDFWWYLHGLKFAALLQSSIHGSNYMAYP